MDRRLTESEVQGLIEWFMDRQEAIPTTLTKEDVLTLLDDLHGVFDEERMQKKIKELETKG